MRTSLIVHYNNDSFISSLDDRMVNIAYNSKRFKYVYLYFNKTNKDRILNLLNNSEYQIEIQESFQDVEKITI